MRTLLPLLLLSHACVALEARPAHPGGRLGGAHRGRHNPGGGGLISWLFYASPPPPPPPSPSPSPPPPPPPSPPPSPHPPPPPRRITSSLEQIRFTKRAARGIHGVHGAAPVQEGVPAGGWSRLGRVVRVIVCLLIFLVLAVLGSPFIFDCFGSCAMYISKQHRQYMREGGALFFSLKIGSLEPLFEPLSGGGFLGASLGPCVFRPVCAQF